MCVYVLTKFDIKLLRSLPYLSQFNPLFPPFPRNLDLANAAAEKVRSEAGGAVQVYRLDLASLESVRECAAEINAKEARVDVLINNAGVMMCPELRTEEGFEMQIGTNHFGHFLFTNLGRKDGRETL